MPWKEVWRSKNARFAVTGNQAYLKVFEEPDGQWSQGEIFIERNGIRSAMMLSARLTEQDLKKLKATLSHKL